ncbi:MAG: GNAT family N-acetyltransferase [Fibrobacterota bacterium]|nr:GNAT family N-acetyltransferase [Fibrobacterota bacterium]QQS05239.1 MAG: GNAT family N-acetyltransferase [Fibrobacterota bacterium]
MQAYEFEFSAITGKVPDSQGRMDLDTELSEHTSGWILWDQGAPVGLAAIKDHGDHREVAEFYIVPSRRKAGLGRTLASMTFDRFPGAWVVKQLITASAAQDFWGRTLAGLDCQDLSEDRYLDPYWGPVVRQRFTWTQPNSLPFPPKALPSPP